MGVRKRTVTEGTVLRRLVKFDRQYFDQEGVCLVAGVDEVGRGALAGPVVAGAVLIDCDCRIAGVNDSKQVDAGRREALYGEILKRARAVAIGWASAEEIDRINIYQATKLASCRALSALQLKPDVVLTDALRLEGLDVRVEPLVKGDTRSQAIAAASIVAKVTRDRWMRQLDAEYPGYGFAAHKGYAVELHLKALRERNASTIHRHSFRGVDWFEEEYQASLTYQRTVAELRQGLWQAAEVEEVWLSRGYLLPECEFRMLCEACHARSEIAPSLGSSAHDNHPFPGTLPRAGTPDGGASGSRPPR